MIKVDNLSKVFKTDVLAQPFVALKNVSFEIPKGSMTGFLGANGAGKTTSMKIIMDFIRATSGSVYFDPSMGNNRQDIFRKIGYLPERPYFYPHLKGIEFLKLLGGLSDLPSHQIDEAIKYWAPRFKIDHALNRELKTYSKGMLQRAGFLSCVLHNPEVIILDEPLSGLDPIGRKELKDVIVEVHRAGKTVFFSTHIVSDVEEICDQVIFLQLGELKYQGKVSSLIEGNLQGDFEIRVQGHHESILNLGSKGELLPGDVTLIIVDHAKKDIAISEIMKKNLSLVGLEQQRLSLEEIFYKGNK